MRKSWSTVSNSPGALCRISCSVAGLIPGERTSATPRSVLQVSDRHLRRYPIHNACTGGRYPTSERPRSLSRSYHLTSQCVRCTVSRRYCERTRSVQVVAMPAYCANEPLGHKNDHVSWSHLLVGQLFGRKKKRKWLKKKSLCSLRDFGSFRDAVFIPRASNDREELSKIHLAFERE